MTAPLTRAVVEHGLPMTAESVRAILDGTKTQTRRVMRPQPIFYETVPESILSRTPARVGSPGWWWNRNASRGVHSQPTDAAFKAIIARWPDLWAYGQPGDRLWVRETFAGPAHIGDGDQGVVGFGIEYQADGAFRAHGDCGCEGPCSGVLIAHPWKPSIFMPRWASRITLELTGVRVERVQDISAEDAIAEGVERSNDAEHWRGEVRASYAAIWDALNKKRGYGWDVNPWVWVLEFTRVKP